MNKKINKTNVNDTKIKLSHQKRKTRNISISFSYNLFKSIKMNNFTNYFKDETDFLNYLKYINLVLMTKISNTTYDEIIKDRHNHKIEGAPLSTFKKIIEKQYSNDFEFIQNIIDTDIYQLGYENDYGRINGYFIERDIFHIILLDPHHLIFPSKNGQVHKNKDLNNYNFCMSEVLLK